MRLGKRPVSLRVKVVLVILLTSAAALALASAAYLIYQYSSQRDEFAWRIAALANVAGDNCRAPLVFGDRPAARRTLAALVADSRVVAAAVYKADGRLWARFGRLGSAPVLPPTAPDAGYRYSGDQLAVARPIDDRGERLGTVVVIADAQNLEAEFRAFVRAGAGVLALALLLATVLAARLQRIVSGPLLALLAATRRVTESGDFAVRVQSDSGDELGRLADSFNSMLEEIGRRDVALRQSEERYALAVRGAQDGIWDWDLEHDRIYFSPRWLEIVGCDEGEPPTRIEAWTERIHPEDAEVFKNALDAHLAGRTHAFEVEHRVRHQGGAWLWTFARGVAVRDGTGRVVRMAGSLADVTARKGRDALTGLPNRVLMVDRIENALQRLSRRNAQFALVAVELDRLELVNESLGRAAGRDLLLAAADRLLLALRPHDKLARLDGGVFAVLVEDIRDVREATLLASLIHSALSPAFEIGGQKVVTTSTVGIALSESGYRSAEDVLRDAQAALGRARTRGGMRTEVFDERIRAWALARLDLETELRHAVERGHLELAYQPIVTLADRRLAGVEALVRWPRGDGTISGPQDFLPLAEETGIIVPLGRWVIAEACRQLRSWRAAGVAGRDFAVSVNVSVHQLESADFAHDVEQALGENSLDPELIKLEITESALLDHEGSHRPALTALHDLGVGLWLDDFGTGYSNLSYLRRFPLEAMKIDRSFVAGLAADARERDLVETLLTLARNLGMKTIAEGVETVHQMRRLKALRCDLMQGQAISLPLTASAVPHMLDKVSA